MTRIDPWIQLQKAMRDFGDLAMLYDKTKTTLRDSRQENFELHLIIQGMIVAREIEASQNVRTVKA
jgi:hypothetical protein